MGDELTSRKGDGEMLQCFLAGCVGGEESWGFLLLALQLSGAISMLMSEQTFRLHLPVSVCVVHLMAGDITRNY